MAPYAGNNLSTLENGLDNALSTIQNSLNSNVYDTALPLLGQLQDLGNDNTQFLTELRNALQAGLTDFADVATVQAALFDVLGPGGANVLLDQTEDGSITVDDVMVDEDTDNVEFDLALGQTQTVSQAIASDLGLPSLGLSLDGSAEVEFEYAFNLNVGVNANTGFYIDTDAETELDVSVEATLPDFAANATLGFLQFDVTDESSIIDADFSVDLTGDGLNADDIETDLNLNTDINLNLAASLGDSAALPSISTDFNLDWTFDDFNVGSETALGGAVLPEVGFNDVTLDFGSFISDFAGPILNTIQTITEPFQPVINILTTDIDLKFAQFNLLDLAETLSDDFDEGDAQFVEALAQVITVINSLDAASNSNLQLNLGGFDFGGADIRDEGFTLGDINPLSEGFDLNAQIPDEGGEAEFVAGFTSTPGEGLQFPIISDPSQAFNLLLGNDADLFTFDLPQFGFTAEFSQYFGIVGPLGVRVGGLFGAGADLAFGFDTFGIREYALGADGEIGTGDDFSNPALIFEGFYVNDTEDGTPGGVDVPEFFLNAGLEASVELNFGVAAAGAGGGLYADLNFNLNDLNNDGRVRPTEFAALISQPLCLFDTSLDFTAGLHAYVRFGVNPFAFTKRFDGPEFTLASFGFPAPCDLEGGGNSSPPPILATPIEAGLRLNMGPNAPDRIHGDITDGGDGTSNFDEYFIVRHEDGVVGDETVVVYAFSTEETHNNVDQIIANGAEGNDIIQLEADVLSAADLQGGNGDDVVVGGAGNDDIRGNAGFDLLDGQDGIDVLQGNGDDDWLIGGAGGDDLQGGNGQDTASYETAEEGILLDLDTGEATGDAAGDTFSSIEQYAGSQFSDTMRGTNNNDLLAGLGGNDRLVGRDGQDFLDGGDGDDRLVAGNDDDQLIGGAGGDQLQGGNGYDIASYATANEGILLNLVNPNQNTGDAEGDTFDSVEEIHATFYNDMVRGDAAANVFLGLAGDDMIDGGGGDDVLRGSQPIPGDIPPELLDAIVIQDDDVLIGGAGGDVLDGGIGEDTASYRTANVGVIVDLLNLNNNTNDAAGDSYIDIEIIEGSNLADELIGDSDGNIFHGAQGNDLINGNGGADMLLGNSGRDTINGGFGNDTIDGGQGDDTINGDWGNDTLNGGQGDDTIGGDRGADVINGGDGDDQLSGDRGADEIDGGAGNDFISGGIGNDTLNGGDGNDNINGGAGADDLFGDEGNDILDGGDGNDRLFGGDGNDQLFASSGRDRLEGGLGDDGYLIQNPFNTGGSQIEDEGGSNDTLSIQLQNVVLDNLAPGQTGMMRLGNILVIDLSQDGAMGSNDLMIHNFFARRALSISNANQLEGDAGLSNQFFTVTATTQPGSGFIENVDGIDGEDILDFFETNLTVDYSTIDASAQAGSDYVATSGTLNFTPAQTFQQISVPIIGDIFIEPTEGYGVYLSNAINGALVDSLGNGVIQNDDTPTDPTTVEVEIDDVVLWEGDVGTTPATFTVTLSNPSNQVVTIDYSTSNGTAIAPNDYLARTGRITFNPGQTSQTINIPVQGDLIDEPTETFFVNLSQAVNATLVDNQGIGNIRDDDDPVAGIRLRDGDRLAGDTPTRDELINPASGASTRSEQASLSSNLLENEIILGATAQPQSFDSRSLEPFASPVGVEPTNNLSVDPQPFALV